MSISNKILYPTLVWSNKKGERIFATKQKSDYFLFEKHEELLSPEDQEKFAEVWLKIRDMAFRMNLPLFNVVEVTKKISEATEQFKGFEDTKKDIVIEIMDYASGSLNDLTIGMTKVSDERAKQIEEEQKEVDI